MIKIFDLFIRLSIFLVINSLVITSPSLANSEYLWETDAGGLTANVNNGVDIRQIPLHARLKNINIRIPQSNPDSFQYGIRFSESFSSAPFSSDKKLHFGIYIWTKNSRCIFDGGCDKIYYIEGPKSWNGIYPEKIGFNKVKVYKVLEEKGKNTFESKLEQTNCDSPWWINRDPGYGIAYFQLSITCLELPKDFYTYTFAGADSGIKPIPYNFLEITLISNPFWSLAREAYLANSKQQTEESNSEVAKNGVELEFQKFEIKCKKANVVKTLVKKKVKCPNGYKLLKSKALTTQK